MSGKISKFGENVIYMKRIPTILLLFTIILATSCGKDKANNFTIACLSDTEPFGYYDASGKLTGFEVELINAIAVNQDINIKLKPMVFENILSELQRKHPKIDGAISLITWTAARRTYYEFSFPYMASGIAVALSSTNSKDVSSIEDMSGMKVALKSGTYIEEYALAESEQTGFTVIPYSTSEEAFGAVSSGAADAVMEEYPLIVYKMGKSTAFKLAYTGNQNQMLSLAMKVGAKSSLIDIFNVGLQNLKADGTYDSILHKYFPSF